MGHVAASSGRVVATFNQLCSGKGWRHFQPAVIDLPVANLLVADLAEALRIEELEVVDL